MSKLTLSIDETVVRRAKRYAGRRGVSVSKLVETYLAFVSDPPPAAEPPPILSSLRGVLKKGGVADYRRHLVEKYR
ncbi:MAG: DUF6364 family protein [Acidobacteriota bacterium]